MSYPKQITVDGMRFRLIDNGPGDDPWREYARGPVRLIRLQTNSRAKTEWWDVRINGRLFPQFEKPEYAIQCARNTLLREETKRHGREMKSINHILSGSAVGP